MVHQKEPLKFSHLETVLSAAVLELQRNKKKLNSASTKDDIALIQVCVYRSIQNENINYYMCAYWKLKYFQK